MSRRVLLYTASSLDGFVARKDGSIDWLDPYNVDPDGGHYGYDEFVAGIDATLTGRKTFDQMLTFPGPFPFKGYDNYVFTRSQGAHSHPDVTFVSSGIPELVRALKQKKGKNIWLVGGGQMNSLMLSEGLIDEIIVSYIPVVLGEGLPLFPAPAKETSMTVVKERSWKNGVVQMTLHPKAG